ncbi:hypothetical protein pb186bvf_017469 [Paramecium bursaria]
MKGFNLNFQMNDVMTFEQENELFAGKNIKLNFTFGDQQFDYEFKLGQDVEWAKKCVAEKIGLARNEFDLFHQEKLMPEFFSLNDIPNLMDQSIVAIKIREL